MDFTVESFGDIVVVRLPGDVLDAGNSKEFSRDVSSFLKENGKVVFDMSQVQFVDSSGCGALMSCLRKLNSQGGELKFCHVTKPVSTLFRLIRMNRIFDIFETREEAVGAFQN